MSRFSTAEVLDLIAEVGHNLQLCDRQITSIAKPEYGFAADTSIQCRPIRGYVAPEKVSITQIGNEEVSTGGLMAYVSAADLNRDDLHPTTFIAWGANAYQIEYREAIMSQGTIVLHKLELKQTEDQTSVAQPDDVINFLP